MPDIPNISEQEEAESIAKLLEEMQRATSKSIRRRGLNGDEFHPLVVIDLGLFNLCCTARLAAGTFGTGGRKDEIKSTPEEKA